MVRRILLLALAVLMCMPAGALAEGTPMTMFINSAAGQTDKWGQDEFSQEIIKQTGVQLTLEKPAADDNQKLNLMLASGSQLPDLILFDKTNPAYAEMVEAGMLLPLDQLIDQYAPEFKQTSFYQSEWALMRYDDGNVYYVPGWWSNRDKIDTGAYLLGRNGYYVREDLMKELGNPQLETLDDLKQVLTQAQQAYPQMRPLMMWDPLAGIASPYGATSMFYFSMGGEQMLELDEEGVVRFSATSPLFKETLRYMFELNQAGLVNKSDFTDTTDQRTVYNSNGQVFLAVGAVYRAGESNGPLAEAVDGAAYIAIDHLKADAQQAEVLVPASMGLGGAGINVTRDCADPEAAIRLITYLASDEGQALQMVGVEGKHWSWVEPGRALDQIGEYKQLNADWNGWADVTGGYKYVWAGGGYFDSAFAWGLAASDPYRRRTYEVESLTRDATMFDDILPTGNVPEAVALQKVNDQWSRYLPKIILAEGAEDFEAQYQQLMSALQSAGLEQIEQYATTRYNQRNGIQG